MRRRLGRWGAALATLAVVVVGTAAPAFADELSVREIDTTDFPEVEITAIVTGERPDLGQVQVRENDELLQDFEAVPLTDTSQQIGIVLVIDVSGSMAQRDAIVHARAAARRFVEQAPPNSQIAIVAFGSSAKVVLNFTDNEKLLLGAIDRLVVQGETALYDGVRRAAALFDEVPPGAASLQPNIVVLSDGNDTTSSSSLDQAVGSVLDADAVTFTVGLETAGFRPDALERIASESGGRYFPSADPARLVAIYDEVQASIKNQYLIRYTSTSEEPVLDIVVSAPGLQARASAPIGSLSSGDETQPKVIEHAPTPGFLRGTFGLVLGITLALVAISLIVFVVILLFVRDSSALDAALQPYAEEGRSESFGDRSLSDTATDLFQQAVAVTSRFAERQGILPRVEKLLEKANLPLRAGEALVFYLGFVAVGTALVLVISRQVIPTVLALALLALAPPGVVSFMAGQRHRKFTGQLPDTLQLLGGSLRAGYSLMQGVEAVSQEVEEPMGKELRRVVVESRLGRPLEEALDDSAERMESPDFGWAVMAIKIQREVGGNLAELLETVSETMVARERLRREVRALTAEGRISAIILGALPIGLLVMLYLINPDYIELLFEESLGKLMLAGAAVLAGVGFYWLKRIVEIEI